MINTCSGCTCNRHCSSFGRQRNPGPPQWRPSPSQNQRCTVCTTQETSCWSISSRRSQSGDWLREALWPGPAEFDEQRSWTFQVHLIDGVVFVRVLVVSTAPSTEPLPLAINLQMHTEMGRLNPPLMSLLYPEVWNIPAYCGWKDLGSWRRWICPRSTPVEVNKTLTGHSKTTGGQSNNA